MQTPLKRVAVATQVVHWLFDGPLHVRQSGEHFSQYPKVYSVFTAAAVPFNTLVE
jgi:hypothetical protein